MLVLGIVIGLLVAILIVATMTYFRRVIEHKVTIIEKTIEAAGPKPKGYIVLPTDEDDEVREEVIARNRKMGRDTKIEELL